MSALKRILLLLPLLGCITKILEAQQPSRIEYIIKYKDLAINNMNTYKIPASIILAQACLESGDGKSKLAVEANNHFGIKCHTWEGETIYIDDDSKNECFRRYPKTEDSYRDHAEFLTTRARYQPLFKLDIKDYKGWAYGLKSAGYATNPSYPQLLIKIIEEYQLYKYDAYDHSPLHSITNNDTFTTSPTLTYKVSLTREILKINGVSYIISQTGEDWESIATEYNLFENELKRFNDAGKEDQLKPNTIVYLAAKKRKYRLPNAEHIVEQGETIRDISQKYAIKLSALRKINKITAPAEPAAGTILKLK